MWATIAMFWRIPGMTYVIPGGLNDGKILKILWGRLRENCRWSFMVSKYYIKKSCFKMVLQTIYTRLDEMVFWSYLEWKSQRNHSLYLFCLQQKFAFPRLSDRVLIFNFRFFPYCQSSWMNYDYYSGFDKKARVRKCRPFFLEHKWGGSKC